MLQDEFKLSIEPISQRLPLFRWQRIKTAYQDVLNIEALALEVENGVAGQDVFELSDRGEYEHMTLVFQKHERLVTLLKSMHIFADIYISMLIGEVSGEGSTTLNSFLKNPSHPLLSLDANRILPAYCVVAYRNKVIAHQDVARRNGYHLGNGKIQHRLIPFPEAFHISPVHAAELLRLKATYSHSIDGLAEEENQYEQLRILFYGIPIGTVGNVNTDRTIINRIAEAGGCRSMSRQEIIDAIDMFTTETTRSVLKAP